MARVEERASRALLAVALWPLLLVAASVGASVSGGLEPFGELGPNDFRISFQQGTGDPAFDASGRAVAYNPNADEYLVVWSGKSDCQVGDSEIEIRARRLDATGALLGEVIPVSQVGPRCDADYEAVGPAVAYNATRDEYLVVWYGDDDVGGLVEGEYEIFAQVLSSDGVPIGFDFRISDLGGTGGTEHPAFEPAVAWNAAQDEYLVVWWGKDDAGDLADELEIFGQRLDGVGAELGANDFPISDMGGVGDAEHAAFHPAVVWNATENEYLVVWSGTDDATGTSDGENEIFAQRLDGSGVEVGANDFRVSDMGDVGKDNGRHGFHPAVAWNASRNEYLVTWGGDDEVGGLADDELEIFGQRLDAAGVELGVNDFRISDMGGTGDSQLDAHGPAAVVWNATEDEYLVVWHGDDDVENLADDEREVFCQRLDGQGTALGINDFRISDMGGIGDEAFDAFHPAVAWNATANEYLVVWSGDDDVGGLVNGELEVFGERLGRLSLVFVDGFESGSAVEWDGVVD